jgi:hypothetical protein
MVTPSTRYSANADFILTKYSARSVPEATILAISERQCDGRSVRQAAQ